MIKNGQILFKSYRTFLREILPESKEVRKITLNPGFSCPNLDGTKGKGGCTYCNNKGFSPAFSFLLPGSTATEIPTNLASI